MMNTKTLLTTVAAAAFAAGSASGALIADGTVIGVDFGGTTSTNNFNVVSTDGTYSTITNIAGDTLAGVGLVASGGITSNGLAKDNPLGSPTVFLNDANILGDWALKENGTFTFTFTGLDDSFSYELVLGGANGSAASVDTTWNVDGQTKVVLANDDATSFVTFTGLELDGSGELVITGSAGVTDARDFASVSALALTAVVPEPGSLALLGLGGLLIGARRRRA